MSRVAVVPFAVFLVVFVVCVCPSHAVFPYSSNLTQEELIASIIINQLEILKDVNESSSFIASHDDEMNQLRQDIETQWHDMNETVAEGISDVNDKLESGITTLTAIMNNEIQRLNVAGKSRARKIAEMNNKINVMDNRVERRMRELAEGILDDTVLRWMNETADSGYMSEVNAKIQSMERSIAREVREFGEQMETEINNKIDAMNQRVQRWMDEMNKRRMNDTLHIMEKLEAVQNAATVHHQRPDPADLYARHNDTYESLCDGHKVLHGGHGKLKVVSSGNYTNNEDCSWTVTLPEGSRPVFRWYYFDLQDCPGGCTCDFMYIHDPNHPSTYYYCGNDTPDGSFLTIMNNKFIVKFHSDDSKTGRGFKLLYRAVEMMH